MIRPGLAIALLLLAGCGGDPRPGLVRRGEREAAAGAQAWNEGNASSAAARFSAAVDAARAVDDRPALVVALHNRGTALCMAGSHAQAETDLRESLAVAASLKPDPALQAATWLALAQNRQLAGDAAGAAAAAEACLPLARAGGDRELATRALASRAALALAAGDPGRAATLLAEAETSGGREPASCAILAAVQARIHLARGDQAAAIASAMAAIGHYRAANDPAGVATGLAAAAEAADALARGDTRIQAATEAALAWERAASAAAAARWPQRAAAWWLNAARAWDAGDAAAAARCRAEAGRIGSLR